MTGIPSLIGSLKKNRSVVEELATTTQNELGSILNQMNRLLQLVAKLQEAFEENQATEEELTREASTLEGEIAAESRERSKLESTNTAQQQVLIEAKAEREKLQQKVTAAKKKLENQEDEIRNFDRGLQETETALKEIDEKLSSSDDEFVKTLQELEAKTTEAIDQAEMQDAKYRALRYLIRENIITMPEAKVAAELKDKDSTTLDHLQKTTFIGRFKVKEIIEQMAERKIVKFDKGSGQVKVLKPIDL